MKRITDGMDAPDFTFDTPWEKSLRFYDILKEGKNTALIFLRYIGCPLCQMKISELIRDYERFREQGITLMVVLQSTPENIKNTIEQKVPFSIVCDPEQKLFSLYGVRAGSIFRYATPSVIKKAIRARKAGFAHGTYEGNERQLPALFIVDPHGKVVYSYYGKNVGDMPDNRTILGKAP
jgi:peroxiredoxin